MGSELTHAIYGASLCIHNIFAMLPVGFAVLMLFYGFSKGINHEKNSIRFLLLELYTWSFILSVISGFAFELEFNRFWPEMEVLLSKWREHPLHFSAVGSFFAISLFLTLGYKINIYLKRRGFLLYSFFLLLLTFGLSFWGIFLNTIMQSPGSSFVDDNGILHAESPLSNLFFSSYHIVRQLHISGASTLKALLLFVFIILITQRKLLSVTKRFSLIIWMVTLAIIGITGHLQAQAISKLQKAKFSSMVGVFEKNDDANWYLIGFMKPDNSISGITIHGGLSLLTQAEILPLNEMEQNNLPNTKWVFNSFHWMIGSYIALVAICIFFARYWGSIRLYHIAMTILIIESSVVAGWILSETGRQPWLFYELVRNFDSEISHIHWSVVNFMVNSALVLSISIGGLMVLIKGHKLKFP